MLNLLPCNLFLSSTILSSFGKLMTCGVIDKKSGTWNEYTFLLLLAALAKVEGFCGIFSQFCT